MQTHKFMQVHNKKFSDKKNRTLGSVS